MATPPFTGASETEVLSRVWTAQLRRLASKGAICSPADAYRFLISPHLDAPDGWPLSTVALSWKFYQDKGLHTAEWKRLVLERSRAGLDWRRCIYFEYKATRRRR